MTRLLFLLLLPLPGAPAWAQERPAPADVSRADSLREDDAVRRALGASPVARAARARLEAAQAAQALGQRPLVAAPEAEVSTTLGPMLVPEADDHTTEAAVSVTLERPAVRRARRAAAGAAYDAATATAQATLDALVYEVRAAYAALGAQETFARLAETLHADADTLVEAVALRFRVGDASELDLRLARLDAVRAGAEADASAGEAAETRARLAALLGTKADALPPLASPAPWSLAPPDTLAISDTLAASAPPPVTTPPAVAAAEAATREAEALARYARAQVGVPTITLRGGLGYTRLFFGRDDLDADPLVRDGFRRLGRSGVDVFVGVAVPLPFGSPARREAALAEAEALARGAEAGRVAAELSADAAAATARLRRAEARQARYRSAASDVSESLYLLRLAYSGGEIGLETLLTGRARLYDTLAATLRASAEATQARLALAHALGTVSAGLRLVP